VIKNPSCFLVLLIEYSSLDCILELDSSLNSLSQRGGFPFSMNAP
jgi:hypothetical protein